MRKKFVLLLSPVLALTSLGMTSCGGRESKPDVYDKDGRLKISLRNLYFDAYTEASNDRYLRDLQKRFEVSLSFQAYSWSNWETQVNGQVNGDNLPDVFHANIDSYNYANYYKFWAEEEMIKPLPEDLSAWPNLKAMIDNTTNIDSLKLNGKLYGIPISKKVTGSDTTFSPFTYVYRRDWAKKYGVYQENDIYTWEQFEALLDAFARNLPSGKYPLGDVEWGYPSIVNFYKQVPHCFAYNESTHEYVNCYTTDDYIKGLEKSKYFRSHQDPQDKSRNIAFYYPSQNSAADGKLNTEYYGNKIGVLYENLSYSNYETLRKQLITSNTTTPNFNIDDAMAIMKIKAPADSMHANKYVLEGTDNWFSMTFFDWRISDKKQAKVLDIIDWLLGEEGTRFAIYGIKDYDYYIDDDNKIQIIDEAWPKDPTTGEYAPKANGAKCVRYLASLGYDTLSYDPLTNKKTVAYLEGWEEEMNQALANNQLDVLKEKKEVMWLTSRLKAKNSGLMRENALVSVMNYIYGKIKTLNEYKGQFGYPWPDVLKEINNELKGK